MTPMAVFRLKPLAGALGLAALHLVIEYVRLAS